MKVSYKRPAAMLLATVVAVVFAGSVSRTVYAETTLERLQKAKAEKEKTEDAKRTQRTGRSLWKLRKTPC